MEFLTADIQDNAGEPVNISVMLTDNGTPVNNTLVNFTTDLGILNSSSAYSNSSGIAEVTIDSTTAGTAHINASAGSVYNLTNVTFLPLEISSIVVETDHAVNAAGNVTNITFYLKDIFGNINSSEDISLKVTVDDVLGNTIPDNELSLSVGKIVFLDVNRTDSDISYTAGPDDRAILSLNSTIAGYITINSSVGSVSNVTYIEIIPGLPGLLKTVYNDDYTVNTSSSFYVSVFDRYENPVENANITFSATSPASTVYNSPVTYNSASLELYNGLTGSNGQLSNVFRTDKRAGGNIISISVANSSLQHNITITGLADEIDELHLTHSPEYALSNNEDSYVLSARPVDQFLNPILPLTTPIKEQVRFTTTSGTVLLIPLNSQGRANIVVGPTPYVESLSINATYKNESGYTGFTNNTTLYFIGGELDSIDLYAVPNAVLSQDLAGNHESNITLVALDEWGHSLSGISVILNNTNTTVGTLTVDGINSTDLIYATTDSEGRIYGIFTGNVSGNTSIIASTGNINVSTNISVKAEPFMSVYLGVSPNSVTSGSLINITTIISIEGELPIVRPAASAMLVLDRSGSMDPDYYAGTPLDVVLVIDRSGSMSGQPIIDARNAAKEFMDNLVSNSETGVVSFASSSRVDMGMTLLNSYDNKISVKSAIDTIDDGGYTAMGEGMADANDLLINHGRSDARKVMVVLTDGETNTGDDQEGENAIAYANANGVTIYTIGLGTSLDEPLLRHIASETGGQYYNAPDSSDLSQIYQTIAQELSDYDISDIEYGVEGFTPYDYTFQDSLEAPASVEGVTLKFEGYDLDTVFNAGSDYGGSSAGECLIQINGNNFDLIPSSNTGINEQWDDYEYDISAYMQPGINTITFYDYYYYETGSNWNNRVRNVEVFWNGTKIASYPEDTELYASGYGCSVDIVEPFETNILINETINDLKVQLDWEDAAEDFYLQLTSPSGHIYGLNHDTTGYYPNGDISEYIWIQPLSYLYPADDSDTVEIGNWTITVIGTGTDDFTINTYIDKKSAAKISSHAFMTSFDESRGDKAGLALYSFEDVVQSSSQTSYILDDSTWVGYFTVDETGYYIFNVSWDDASLMNVYLYDGIDVLDSSSGSDVCEVSSMLSAGDTYYVEVAKGAGSLTDTQFTINVSTSSMDSIMAAYYESGYYYSGGGGTPRYRTLDGSEWSEEKSANYIGGSPYFVVLESSPVGPEVIMGTGDSNSDVNVQVWDGSSWGSVNELSTNTNAYSRRGFDIKYEQVSGDAIVVYTDRYIDNGIVPRYTVWDGSSWSSAAAVDGLYAGSGRVNWVKLAADPNSDKMALVTQDDSGRIRAQVWDGDSWGNSEVITDDADGPYQSFDVTFDNDGNIMVIWADWSVSSYTSGGGRWWRWSITTYDCDVRVGHHIFNGGIWSSDSDVYDFSYTQDGNSNPYSNYGCWIKIAADPDSDDMIMALSDAYNIRYATWDGSEWDDSLSILENNVQSSSTCPVDVAFEQESGDGIVVWGTNSNYPRYSTWDGSVWSDEESASYIGAYPRCVKLIPGPASEELFLMTSDSNSDINIQKWDGSAWGDASEVETSSSGDYECFDLAFSGQGASAEATPVSWNQWTASVTSTLQNDSLSHLSNAIDTITADGLTAIDEGLYVANNELSSVDGNSTIVLMTDGLDNAGYQSLLEEAYRAKENNTVIYTVGFGNDESEVDPVLEEIATITGGEYYFAPNSSVLKDIFQGIAMQITNFSAGGPVLKIDVPYNVTPLSMTKATYISGSSNATTGNVTTFVSPRPPATGNAEPSITTTAGKSTLQWQLPTMGSGDRWGIWYQMRVDGKGYVSVILPTSTITYTDLDGEIITVSVPASGSASLGGTAAGAQSYGLGSLEMMPDERLIFIDDSTQITLTVEDINGSPSYAFVILDTDLGYFNNYENPFSMTLNGSDTVDFTSAVAGKAHITARAYNLNNVSEVLQAKDIIVVRPKGAMTIS
ncbi:MAG: VWA domain-containing protein [Methanolobus sp.]|nr:VWA domain-containing protein [Methanolobus sp.]